MRLSKDLLRDWQALHDAIQEVDRISLSTHENPDGDGLGSQLAFCEYLMELGKDCRILNCSPAPKIYEFLDSKGRFEVYHEENDADWLSGCDLAIVFDVGDYSRLRCVGDALLQHRVPIASIDHHPQMGYDSTGGQSPYKYLVLDYSAPSTGTMIWQYLLEYRSAPLTESMANALYTAVVTDTGSFKYDNTDERAHLMAMDLIRAGVHPYFIHKRIYEQRTPAQVRLLGLLISNIRYTEDRHIGWSVLTGDDLRKAGASLEEVDGFSEFIRTIKGVEISALMTEVAPDQTKVSLRSKGTLEINDIARQLGGGGHAFASGALVNKPWPAVEELLIPLLQEKVNKIHVAGEQA